MPKTTSVKVADAKLRHYTFRQRESNRCTNIIWGVYFFLSLILFCTSSSISTTLFHLSSVKTASL